VLGVIQGFSVICVVITTGWLLARRGVLGGSAQEALARVTFWVASPALMLTVLADADPGVVFSGRTAATVAGVLAGAVVYLPLARWWWRRRVGELVVGTMSAVYVNAANLGLPIAAYVLGDASLVAPVLLLQLLVMQPVALLLLDVSSAARGAGALAVLRSTVNPITVASVVGVALSVTGAVLPTFAREPLDVLGGLAVPAMLLAYGISLHAGPRPGAADPKGEVGLVSAIKLVLQPLVVYVTAEHGLGLEDATVFAVTVLAALPTAQNVFVHAATYGHGLALSRDAVFVTTAASLPVVLVLAAVLPHG
jgi:predicted permease